MTPLRQRMLNDMTVRGFADTTKQIYISAVFALARHYHRSPDRLSAEKVQLYLVFLHEKRHLRWNTCNVHRHALRFLFRVTLM